MNYCKEPTRPCKNCGKIMVRLELPPSSKKNWSNRVFCSRECQYVGRKNPPKTGINLTEYTCSTCGVLFKRYSAHRKCKTIHCSRKCAQVSITKSLKERKLPESFYEHMVKIRKERGSYNFTPEHCKKISESHLAMDVRGEKNPNWRGGKGEEHQRLRKTRRYYDWRTSVFTRDNWTCIWCGVKGSRKTPIQADHIKPFTYFPELRFDINNGRTLCVPCHKKTDTWGANSIRLYA